MGFFTISLIWLVVSVYMIRIGVKKSTIGRKEKKVSARGSERVKQNRQPRTTTGNRSEKPRYKHQKNSTTKKKRASIAGKSAEVGKMKTAMWCRCCSMQITFKHAVFSFSMLYALFTFLIMLICVCVCSVLIHSIASIFTLCSSVEMAVRFFAHFHGDDEFFRRIFPCHLTEK